MTRDHETTAQAAPPGSKAPTAIGTDLQDIDKRLANLQHFLLQSKSPMSTT